MSEKASVHGHEVMNMIIESGKNYTTESLIADIHATFARGKFIGTEEGFSTSAEKICNH